VVLTDAIIDTRAQKMVSHTVAHYRIGFARDQHWEKQNTLSSQNYIVIHTHKKWLVMQQHTAESMFAHDQHVIAHITWYF